MSRAWIYQDDKQVKKHGEKKASYYVGWLDPEGKRRCKSCGPGSSGKNAAQKLRSKRQAELIAGTYQSNDRKTWADFRKEYEARIIARLAPRSQVEVLTAFNHFERLINPKRMFTIKTTTVDEYTSKRRVEAGKKKGDLVSPATVNKELRHLRAALKKADKWGYVPKMPDFDLEPEPKKLPTYILPEHFAAVYKACDQARLPTGQAYSPADWWRAILVTGYMTGWRISDMLGLRREDLDLKDGSAITRFEDNKGKRDELVKFHPVVVDHLRKLSGFGPTVFPWPHDRRTLLSEFATIQEAAKIKLPCRGKHEHTRFCHVYGFHDLRRAFATMNAAKLTPDALQALMRHKSYLTTQKYINMTRQLDEAVASLHVPEILKPARGGSTK
jgi:integrase